MKVEITYTEDTTIVLFTKRDLILAQLVRIGMAMCHEYECDPDYFFTEDFEKFINSLRPIGTYAVQIGKQGIACGTIEALIAAEKAI